MGIYLVVYGHIDINMAHHLGVLGASTTIGQSRKYSPDTRRSLETELGTGSGVAEKKQKKTKNDDACTKKDEDRVKDASR